MTQYEIIINHFIYLLFKISDLFKIVCVNKNLMTVYFILHIKFYLHKFII